MIRSIELMNWKSHSASRLEFSSGVNGLIGIMGSGKSSIMDAICFGLFGTFPKLQQRKVKLEDMVMKKPVDSKRGEIIVEFDSNGKTYTVKRVIDTDKRGGSSAEIREDGKMIDANPKHVTDMVERILKTDYELFSRAVYSEQNQIDYFLTIPKSDRKKKIDELIRINKFEIARANAKTLENRLENLKESKKAIIESLRDLADEKRIEETCEQIKTMESQIAQMRAKAETLGKDLPKLYDSIAELENDMRLCDRIISEKKLNDAAMERTKSDTQSIKSRISGKGTEKLKDEIKSISSDIDEAGKILDAGRKDFNSISMTLVESEARINSLSREMQKIDSEIKQKEMYEKELEEIESGFSDIEKFIDLQKNRFEKEMEASKTFQARMKEIENNIREIEKLGDKCPLCDNEITEERKNAIISERNSRLKEIRECFETTRTNMEKMKSEISEIERFWRRSIILKESVKGLEKLRKEFEGGKEIVGRLMKTSSDERQNLENMSQKLKSLEVQLEDKKKHYHNLNSVLEWASEYEKLQDELQKLAEDKKRIAERLKEAELRIKGRDIESMRNELQEKIALKSQLVTKISSDLEYVEERKKTLEDSKAKLELLRKSVEETKKIDGIVNDLEIFSSALERTQIALRENFVEAANMVMAEIWDQLYPYGDFSEVKINIEDADYALQLKERSGRWVDADAASGGERSIACLALRIAFSLALAPNLKWLVLDEPTHNLDSKAVEDLANTLRYGVSDVIEQVFLITHDEKLEDAITGTLYRLERNKANDEATRVIRLD